MPHGCASALRSGSSLPVAVRMAMALCCGLTLLRRMKHWLGCAGSREPGAVAIERLESLGRDLALFPALVQLFDV
jgi:hypothetical protein